MAQSNNHSNISSKSKSRLPRLVEKSLPNLTQAVAGVTEEGAMDTDAAMTTLQEVNVKLKAALATERSASKQLRRELSVQVKQAREDEHQKCHLQTKDLQSRLHFEKLRELELQRDSLAKKAEAENRKLAKVKDAEVCKLHNDLKKLRDEVELITMSTVNTSPSTNHMSLSGHMARDTFEHERNRLHRDVHELQSAKKNLEGELTGLRERDKRVTYAAKKQTEDHASELGRARKEADIEVRRLLDELKSKDRQISQLKYHQHGGEKPMSSAKKSQNYDGGSEEGSASDLPGKPPPGAPNWTPKISDLNAKLSKTEEKCRGLEEEKQRLQVRLKESDRKHRPLLEKNKKFLEKNMELSALNRSLEDRVRKVTTDNTKLYGLVFDAGSSHTQLFIYQWEADKENGTGVVSQTHTCRSKGSGISNYTHNPTLAGESLQPCLDEAKDKVPSERHSHTPIFLGATAGMRLLRDSGNKNTSDAILNSIRQTFSLYPFHYNNSAKQVQIIPGSSEGTYSWATTNYLAHSFGEFSQSLYTALSNDTETTFGALDMGGASTQITFIPANGTEIPEPYKQDLPLYGTDYQVYTHSYLCYGLNEANRQYLAAIARAQASHKTIDSPCHPEGYMFNRHYRDIFEAPCTNFSQPNITNKNITYSFKGTSNDEECNTTVHDLFNWTVPCDNLPCSFNGVHQPDVYGKFYAFSGYYNTMAFYNTTTATLEQFEAQVREICGKNKSELMEYPANPRYITEYCFDGQYVRTLLVEGYKFTGDKWSTLIFTNKVSDVELGWSMGFMLNATNRYPVRYQAYTISLALFVLLVLLFCVFLLCGLCFCCYSFRTSRKNRGIKYRQMSYGSLDP